MRLRIEKSVKGFIKCPNCDIAFVLDDNVRAVPCSQCSFVFCTACLKEVHQGRCDRQAILGNIAALRAAGYDVRQCPRCYIFVTKDKHCDHVKCLECATEWNFCCCTVRSPSFHHGCHYHRPDCPHYSAYHGQDHFLPDKCEECHKLSRLCDRPPVLPEKYIVEP
mmetsp:Transcript_16449/g.7826  ORF Transcript_16449/g.7826 Transcript_16449/m.7826 type:complete len:165 (+) Transcript_16449:118-612(+)